jgi:GMP synthase-like glutamine amidotransferase
VPLRLVVIEQQADVPPGLLGEWAAARGAHVETVRPPGVAAWPDPRDATAVVALGSDRSVHASRDAWIPPQLAYLAGAHEGGIPVLGICFGGQALAAALGGATARAPATEIGWIEVHGEDGYAGDWFTWHGDVFTPPPGATVIARSASGVQAYAVGASVGVQFHPEATPQIVDRWLDDAPDAVPDPGPIRRATARRAAGARKRAFALFDRIAERW